MIKKIERYTRQNVLKAVAFGLVVLLFSPVCPANAQTEPDITTGLVGHWKLDETSSTTAADSSGNGNDGTMQNGLTADSHSVNGRIKNAINTTDDVDYYIQIPHSVSLNITGSAITLAGWMNPQDDTFNSLISKGATGPLYVFRIDKGGSESSWSCVITTNNGNQSVSFDAPTSAWSHVACVYDGSDIIAYVNGVEMASETASGNVVSEPTADVYIAKTLFSFNRELLGYADDVRIYNRALTPEDVAYLYESFDGNVRYDEDARTPKYFNGDDWVAMGPSKYTPNAVAFNGTNDYLSYGSPLAGVSDGKTITASFWAKFNSYPSSGCFTVYNTNPSRVRIVYCGNGTETMQLELRDTGGALRANVGCGPDPHVVDTWYHHLISINMTTGEAHCYVDDADSLQTFSAPTDVTLDFTNAQHTVGAGAGPSELLEGDIADLWIDYETYIDLSIEANRRKFIDADGNPIYLGASGSAPTGSAPDIFLSGDTDAWHTNKGTGGGFTENGALTEADFTLLAADQYLTFISDTLPDGDLVTEAQSRGFDGSDGVLAADYICQNEADAADLSGTYYAWVSGPAADGNAPADRFVQSNAPYVLPNDPTYTKVADDWNDLTNGGIDNEINLMADGTAYTGQDDVWTNVDDDGTAHGTDHCLDWTSSNGANDARRGRGSNTDGNWTNSGSDGCNQANNHLFCFQQTFVSSCSNPARPQGTIIYNEASQVLQFCDGEEWQAMGPVPGDGTGGCSNPTRAEGSLVFNKDYGVMQYCEGDEWVSVGSWTPPPCGGIGGVCSDGSIYAGLSPDGNVPMYTTPADAGQFTWNDGSLNYTDMTMVNCTNNSPGTAATCQTGKANTAFLVGATSEPDYPFAAAEYCAGLSAHGYDDWYLPAQDELNVLYTNKNTGGLNATFNETGTPPAGFYWSSSERDNNDTRLQRFSDGVQDYYPKHLGVSVRCVRR